MNEVRIAAAENKTSGGKEERVKKVMDMFDLYCAYRKRMWEPIARKCERFHYGDQWDAGTKLILEDQHRAPSTFNNVLPVIDSIVGYQASSKVDLIAKPVDKFGDVMMADILSSVMLNIQWVNNAGFERRHQFLDGLITGVGVKEVWLEPDDDMEPIVRTAQGSPWHYYLDPEFEKYDYRDAHWVFKETWMSKEEIELSYGKKVVRQLSITGDGADGDDMGLPVHTTTGIDYGNQAYNEEWEFPDNPLKRGYDAQKRLYRVLEAYEKVHERVEMYYDAENRKVMRVDELDELDAEIVRDETIPTIRGYIRMTTIIADGILAQDTEIRSQKGGSVEFLHLFNFYFPYFVNGHYFGLVENLLYPQEDVNKHYSQILNILNSYANSGLMYEEGAFSPEEEKQLDDKLARTGAAIKLNEGGLTKIQPIERHEAPQSLFTLVGLKSELMKYISRASDAFQGVSKRQQSGRSKEFDISQSAGGLQGIIDNFRETQKMEGKAYIWWVQNFYTGERMVRVLGQEQGQDMTEVELNKQVMGQIFNDVTIGRYDITLDFEGKSASERARNMWMLVELSNTVPQFADIIAESVLELSEIPQKFKILKKMQERQQQQQMMAAQGIQPQNPAAGKSTRPGGGVRRMPQKMQA